jgi:hypothetical protein
MATTTISIKKRQANRRNALRSTGPKSDSGKQRASENARKHGLTGITGHSTPDPLLDKLSRLIQQDGIESNQAEEIAAKLLSYERNQAYQRELFLKAEELKHSDPDIQEEMRKLFGTEMDMLDDWLDGERYEKGRVSERDLSTVARLKVRFRGETVRHVQRREALLAKQVRASIRYLKRSSNQLIKSLRAL